MSSTQQIVIDAFRLLGTINAAEESPAPVLMNIGLRAFSQMVDSWAADGLNVTDLTMTGDFTSGGYTVTVESTARLAPGLNVSATGITSKRILSIDSNTQFTLDGACTADGADASISFALLPIQAAFEEGIAAMLARRLAPRTGDELTPIVLEMAAAGRNQIYANFFHMPLSTFDTALLRTSLRG